jgi:hypothetical protein
MFLILRASLEITQSVTAISSYSTPEGQSLLTQQFLPTDIKSEMFWGDMMEPDDEMHWLAILLHIPRAQR